MNYPKKMKIWMEPGRYREVTRMSPARFLKKLEWKSYRERNKEMLNKREAEYRARKIAEKNIE